MIFQKSSQAEEMKKPSQAEEMKKQNLLEACSNSRSIPTFSWKKVPEFLQLQISTIYSCSLETEARQYLI